MKKKTIILFALLALMVGSAKAQWFDFSNNYRASVGLNLGVVGYHFDISDGIEHKDYANFGYGVSLSIAGIYIDFMRQTPEHKFSSQVGVSNWENEHSAFTINLGYQIPVLNWLYVTPLVGYSNESCGVTYANDIQLGNRKLIHKYKPYEGKKYHHFNYGLGVMVVPFRHVGIGGTITSHAVYGSISFNLGDFKD